MYIVCINEVLWYNYDIFNHFSENEEYDYDCDLNPQDKEPDYYCLVIENGFLIYHIIKTLQDGNDPENLESLNNELSLILEKQKSEKHSIFKKKTSELVRKKEIMLSINKYMYCGPAYELNNKVLTTKIEIYMNY